jgi:hypothetical protein
MTKQFTLRYTLFLFFSDLILAVVALFLASYVRDSLPLGKSLGNPGTASSLPWPIYAATVHMGHDLCDIKYLPATASDAAAHGTGEGR